MDVEVIMKIGAIGILVAALFVVLKQAGREEHGLLVTIVGVVVVLTMVMTLVARFFETVRTIFRLY
ncbi:stage III sporulation protein AC [Caldinitratiruptor microaerophilus]|uniref:Stage III sporulation protein AC n=1 Tax=Caldinitratiruptor microaerophilus TaxID=671077 RepID=A0AA35CK47_9FIRM|nr:stage III sporulation protein AC [Caldinitratiruptor microaerophilus]BDG59873.1 stage III sporulation protein AC [Caldinitratiruptor microaerophilus]